MLKLFGRRKPAAAPGAQPDLWSAAAGAAGPTLSPAEVAARRERAYLARWLAWRVDEHGHLRDDVRPEDARHVPRLVAAARARGVDWRVATEAVAVEAEGEDQETEA